MDAIPEPPAAQLREKLIAQWDRCLTEQDTAEMDRILLASRPEHTATSALVYFLYDATDDQIRSIWNKYLAALLTG